MVKTHSKPQNNAYHFKVVKLKLIVNNKEIQKAGGIHIFTYLNKIFTINCTTSAL